MVSTTIFEAPLPESFKTKEDHETQTPESFYLGKPVLHYRVQDATIIMTAHHFPAPDIFHLPCAASPEDSTRIKEKVDIMVTSRNYIIFNNRLGKGLEVPYPDMPLVATAKLDDEPALLVHLDYTGAEPTGQSQLSPIELYIVPKPEEVDPLYSAIQVCSDLNPDPPSQEDEDMEDGFGDRIAFEGSVGYTGISGLPGVQQGAPGGGLPPAFPGSSGWITADNINEYYDEDGVWIKGLGPGAGNVRSRDATEGEETNATEDDSKRARTTGKGRSEEGANGEGEGGHATNGHAINGERNEKA